MGAQPHNGTARGVKMGGNVNVFGFGVSRTVVVSVVVAVVVGSLVMGGWGVW